MSVAKQFLSMCIKSIFYVSSDCYDIFFKSNCCSVKSVSIDSAFVAVNRFSLIFMFKLFLNINVVHVHCTICLLQWCLLHNVSLCWYHNATCILWLQHTDHYTYWQCITKCYNIAFSVALYSSFVCHLHFHSLAKHTLKKKIIAT